MSRSRRTSAPFERLASQFRAVPATGVDVLARLAELTNLSRAVTAADHAARASTLRDIRRLTRGIRERNPAAAAQAMTDHLTAMRQTARAAASLQPRDRDVG